LDQINRSADSLLEQITRVDNLGCRSILSILVTTTQHGD